MVNQWYIEIQTGLRIAISAVNEVIRIFKMPMREILELQYEVFPDWFANFIDALDWLGGDISLLTGTALGEMTLFQFLLGDFIAIYVIITIVKYIRGR